jgi:hypothetical protein
LQEPLTDDQLTKRYRKASVRHHPDRGGDTAKMKVVNAAFSFFRQELIRRRFSSHATEAALPDLDPVDEFGLSVGLTMLTAAVDIYAVDRAFGYFSRLDCLGLLNTPYAQRSLVSMHEDISKMARRLALADMMREAERIRDLFEAICSTAVKCGLSEGHFDAVFAELIRYLTVWRKQQRLVPNHPLQLENAVRLRMMDEYQLADARDRLARLAAEKQSQEGALLAYGNSRGFIADFGLYPTELSQMVPCRIVPDHEYGHVRFAHLSTEQQIEYLHAFSDRLSFDLARKYLWVRLNCYFIALVKHYDSLPRDRVLQEVRVLKAVFPKEQAPFQEVLECHDFLSRLSCRERAERVALLTALDSDEVDDGFLCARVAIVPKALSASVAIVAKAEYVEFMQRSMHSLRDFVDSSAIRNA